MPSFNSVTLEGYILGAPKIVASGAGRAMRFALQYTRSKYVKGTWKSQNCYVNVTKFDPSEFLLTTLADGAHIIVAGSLRGICYYKNLSKLWTTEVMATAVQVLGLSSEVVGVLPDMSLSEKVELLLVGKQPIEDDILDPSEPRRTSDEMSIERNDLDEAMQVDADLNGLRDDEQEGL